MLDSTQEASETPECIPPLLHSHSTGNHQHEAVGRGNHLKEIRKQWGDQEIITIMLIMKHCLEWLWPLARILDHRILKKTLFSWLPQPHPHGGPRRRWRDLVKRDMKTAQVDVSSWFEVALHTGKWHTAYSDGLNNYQQSQLHQRASMPRDASMMCVADVSGRNVTR